MRRAARERAATAAGKRERAAGEDDTEEQVQ